MDREMRIEVLEKALEEVENGMYICSAIAHVLERKEIITGESWDASVTDTALEYFPEFLKYKPADADLYCVRGWFGDVFTAETTKKRVEVLTALIDEIRQQDALSPGLPTGEGAHRRGIELLNL
jgi:hypothetical protein